MFSILKLYNKEPLVVEPAGALSIAALDDYVFEIKTEYRLYNKLE